MAGSVSTESTESTESVQNGDWVVCTERTELSIDIRCGWLTKRTEKRVFNG